MKKPLLIKISIAIVLIAFLVFALIRGCRNNPKDNQQADQTTINNLKSQLASKVSELAETKKKFNDTISVSRQQLKEDQEHRAIIEDSLKKLRREVKALIDKHKLDKYQDTNMVAVPGEYVDDCENCFTKLEKYHDMESNYELRVKKVDSSHAKVEKDLTDRIDQLENEKTDLISANENTIDSCQKIVDQNAPKGKLFLTIGTLAINNPLPNAIGIGGRYQDKRDRQYGAKVYGSPYGRIYEAEVGLPLSLRRKKNRRQ